MFCEARGREGVTFFKGPKRGDVPRVEGGGSRFLRDPKGGGKKKSCKPEWKSTDPPPLLIKNDTSLNRSHKTLSSRKQDRRPRAEHTGRKSLGLNGLGTGTS